jgi:thiamine-monophosphate kinase
MRERDFIDNIRKSVHYRNKSLIKGIGDDCAIIDYTKQTYLIITTDSLCEGTHFNRNYFKPWEIGARSMAVNISDICAMGGVPRYSLVGIGFNKREKQKFIDSIYRGLIDYAENYGIDIIGGDTVGSRGLFLSVTIVGEVEKNRVMTRAGARAGDRIFTTGLLGDSYAGLKVLLARGRENTMPYEYLPVKKHILPLPKYVEGRLLSQSGFVNSCIDISDGLINDTANIASESGKGAEIFTDRLPISLSAAKIAAHFRDKAVDYALYGGEDFELLFTVSPLNVDKLIKFASTAGMPVFEVGRMTAKRGIYLVSNGKKRKETFRKIWDHF